MDYNTFLTKLHCLIEQTTRYTPPHRGDYMDTYDKYVDFPYVDDPKGFVTHKPLEQSEPLGYEDEDDEVEEQSATGRRIGVPAQMRSKLATEQEKAIDPEGAGAEAGAGADMQGGDMGVEDPSMGGMDAGMGGMGGMEQEEPLTSSQIGRVYELKKIYSRLSSVESYLSRATDQSVLELRRYVAQSIDLFEVVISNYDQYKGNVDDIIIQFYEFLDVIYSSLRKYYKEMKVIRS